MLANMQIVMRKGLTADDLGDFGNCNVTVKKQAKHDGYTTVTLRGEYMHLTDIRLYNTNWICWAMYKGNNLLDSGSV